MSSRGTKHEIRATLIGGIVAVVVLFCIIVGVGRPGAFEALRLISAAIPTAQFLASAVLGGALTVLALLLTLLGLGLVRDFHFTEALYKQVAFLTRLSVGAIILSTLILLAVAVPIEEVEEVVTYYAVFYYALAGALALLGGGVIAIGIIIGFILRGVIAIGHPGVESDLISRENDSSDEMHREVSRP